MTKLLSIQLTDAGYTVHTNIGAVGAIDKVKEVNPDLIILDMMMPGINGLEFKGILEKYDSTQSIPVVFLSVQGLTANKEEGLLHGARAYLTKPVEIEKLLQTIDLILDKEELSAD